LLLVVDDVQWLDLASSMALIYALRRLDDADVRMLVAVRLDTGDAFVRSGFRVLDIDPLDEASSEELLVATFPALPANIRRRLRTDAQGNPLALLELPTAFETTGSPRFPEVPPLTHRLQATFADRLQSLPERTRRALLLVVLAGASLDDAVPRPIGDDDLAPAERARILHRNPRNGRLEFRHPLIRSAVVQLSTSDELRAAHRVLADTFARSPQHRAWHLGQAAVEPDEEIAGLLEALSLRMSRDGDADSTRAVTAMLRAAELSPAAGDRARRTARAAYLGAAITGDLTEVRQLLVNAPDVASAARSLAVALAAAYQLLNTEGDAATASRLLLAALHQADDIHDQESDVVEALYTLIYTGYFSGQPELWVDIEAALDRLRAHQTDTMALLRAALNPLPIDPGLLTILDDAVDELRWSADPARTIRVAVAGLYLDRADGVVEPLRRLATDSRDTGAITRTIEASVLLGLHDFGTGQWAELVEATAEGQQLSVDLGFAVTGCLGRFARGLVAAARGESALVDEYAEQVLLWAAPRKLRTFASYASQLHCLAALGASAFEDAYRHATMINPPGTFLAHNPHALWLVLDLAEAAARSGRTVEALAHAEAARSAGLALISARQAMVCTAALALGTPQDAGKLFEEALAVPGTRRWVFDRARVELLYGEHLRRERATTAAKLHLTAALRGFEELLAAPWIERASAELRATGATQGVPLTPQELAVAELAAQGLTNKQIGERLFLSPRTVSTHLHRVFQKVGITARGALRDALQRRYVK
ncbi:MAG TPA: LuxR C-terminal-related transcriptional regulator, partial [Pseudonocardiaceae bacterium]|nr:LuxR C-terminal-related transcriptional regulator [Pseudonocardiaceae bacterium]